MSRNAATVETTNCEDSKKNILAFFNSLKNGPATNTENQNRFFGREHREIQEWMVLGASVGCMEKNGWDHPETAIKTNPPAADFQTFDNHGNPWQNIEITECLPRGYARDRFYSDIKSMCGYQNVSEYSETPDSCLRILKSAIKKKSQKPYAAHSSLIVHVSFRLYKQRGKQHPPLSAVLHQTRLNEVAELRFARIYVLTCGMSELIILK
jgi:hypothetical protein